MTKPDTMTLISPARSNLRAYFQEIWSFRAMIITLAWRDLKVKYAQTKLGIIWAIIQPLTGLLIFTFFFDRLIKLETPGISYPVFAFSGMISWYFFSYIIHGAGMALVEAQDLIKKINLPKLTFLLAKILFGLVDFAISLVLLILIMVLFGSFPDWKILCLPLLIVLNIFVGLSLSIWLSALTIRYRDFHHIIPYLVNFGIWLTPVFYPDTLIPEQYNWLLYMNPMTATIAGFRWALIGAPLPEVYYLLSFIPVLLLLISGLNYFRKIEDEISDYI